MNLSGNDKRALASLTFFAAGVFCVLKGYHAGGTTDPSEYWFFPSIDPYLGTLGVALLAVAFHAYRSRN